ncbi:MAG: cupin domain-containing protein [Halobacteriales archaeon]
MHVEQVTAERWFAVLFGNESAQAAVMTLPPGESTGGPENYHAESDQWLYVIDGAGRAVIEGEAVELSANDLALIEAGESHEIRADEEEALETLNLYVPPEY